ncbi:MAG TPA: pro-sigmaK processing inhibitor BofA family protein [Sphingobacteriaceae bacterium]|nr:pro-sigmaK processing inhibitor BofA family protein [Sphingobacteriaceae bacterium]
MEGFDAGMLLPYAVGLLVLYILVRTVVVPVRALGSAAYHLLVGGAMLWIVNLVGSLAGFHLALNPVSALLAGYLGIPGLVLLAAMTSFLAV